MEPCHVLPQCPPRPPQFTPTRNHFLRGCLARGVQCAGSLCNLGPTSVEPWYRLMLASMFLHPHPSTRCQAFSIVFIVMLLDGGFLGPQHGVSSDLNPKKKQFPGGVLSTIMECGEHLFAQLYTWAIWRHVCTKLGINCKERIQRLHLMVYGALHIQQFINNGASSISLPCFAH